MGKATAAKREPLKETDNGSLWPDAMFLRIHCGEASEDGGDTYQLSTSATHGTPIVTNERTGRTFAFTWQALIRMAKDAGIDEGERRSLR